MLFYVRGGAGIRFATSGMAFNTGTRFLDSGDFRARFFLLTRAIWWQGFAM